MNRNVQFGIITLQGFIMDESNGGMKVYPNTELAMTDMKPGYALIPIKEGQKELYDSGELRVPSVNRAGLRDR